MMIITQVSYSYFLGNSVRVESSCKKAFDTSGMEVHTPNCKIDSGSDCGKDIAGTDILHTGNTGCTWKIVGPSGKQLRLELFHFVGTAGNRLDIYDGPNSKSEIKRRITNYDGSIIESSGNSFYLSLWKEDNSLYKMAFRIIFSIKGIKKHFE